MCPCDTFLTLRLDPHRYRKVVCPDKHSFLADSDEHFTIKAGDFILFLHSCDQSGKDKINKQQEVNMNICVIIFEKSKFHICNFRKSPLCFLPFYVWISLICEEYSFRANKLSHSQIWVVYCKRSFTYPGFLSIIWIHPNISSQDKQSQKMANSSLS